MNQRANRCSCSPKSKLRVLLIPTAIRKWIAVIFYSTQITIFLLFSLFPISDLKKGASEELWMRLFYVEIKGYLPDIRIRAPPIKLISKKQI